MSDRLVLFARFPEPGKVKTRLAEAVGGTEACRLYSAFLEDLLSRFPDATVAVDPPDALGKFRDRFGDRRLVAQTGRDLGARLAACVESSLAAGERVCIIGTDLPHLPTDIVARAYQALEDRDVVLGPAADGGYYLIALRRSAPLFEGIAWSTDRVLAQTLDRARETGLSVAMLEQRSDVDTIDDLSNALDDLLDPGLPATRAAVLSILEAHPALFDGGDL